MLVCMPVCLSNRRVGLHTCPSVRWACMQTRAALTLYLTDEDVGAILGRKGQNLVEIQQVSAMNTIRQAYSAVTA
jgi:predicted RNA-binding protein YlqC (UPF0109 family)